jgi:outer membrane protein OmpA-like peptidoglycan-associated protein
MTLTRANIHKVLITSMILSMMGCKEKVKQPEAKVETLPVASLSTYSKYLLSRVPKPAPLPPKTETLPNPVTPSNTVPTVMTPQSVPKSEITNPFYENKILAQTFQYYIDTGIDDPKMEGMLDKLKEENLTAEELKTITDQYFSILENPDQKLLDKMTIDTRMRSIFELHATNPSIADSIKQRFHISGYFENFTPEELKTIVPMAFASEVYSRLKNMKAPLPISYTSTDSRDGKKYRTIILGQINFSKGSKKKKLEATDLSQIEAVSVIWNGLLTSNNKSGDLAMKIVGFADRDKPSNAKINMTMGLKRAQMVYDAFAQNEALKSFKVESMGDTYPYEALNPKDVANRRAEFFIFHHETPIK